MAYENKKNKRNNKSRSRNGKKDFKKSKDKEVCDTTSIAEVNSKAKSTTNDVSWYMANPQLVNDAARIPFGNQLGRKLAGVEAAGASTVPGLCAMYVVPGPGIAESVTDAVNISATNIFQFVRKNLSTYADYHAADVMMYIMAVDEMYSWYNYIARLFGIANNFSAFNLYYPKALLNANGLWDDQINSLRTNMNDFRARFNSLIYKAASVYMPVDISIVKRHMWMFGNYFMDAESPKAQTYMYVPAGYHLLNETESDNGTMLKYYTIDHSSFSMEEALDVFDSMIEAIRNSSSMLKIAADMRNAYSESQTWTMAYIPENFTILPIVDDAVLSQIMNSIIHPASWNSELNFDVIQSVTHNKIIYVPEGEVTDAGQSSNVSSLVGFSTWAEADGIILNFFKPKVEVEDIVEATRNISLFRYDYSTKTVRFETSGADIIVGARMFYKVPDGSGDFEIDYREFNSYDIDTIALPVVTMLHAFNWAPNVYIFQNMGTMRKPAPFIAYDNYAQVNLDTIKRLNEGVLTSMWQVPDFKLPTSGR